VTGRFRNPTACRHCKRPTCVDTQAMRLDRAGASVGLGLIPGGDTLSLSVWVLEIKPK
jgi:hypothetical protein